MEEFEVMKCQDLVDEDFAESEMDDLFGDGYEGVDDVCQEVAGYAGQSFYGGIKC